MLTEAARQGERGRAHAVGDHEDEVPLGGGRVVVVSVAMSVVGAGLLSVLDPDGDDDNGGRGQQGPDEEAELADARGSGSFAVAVVIGSSGAVAGE